MSSWPLASLGFSLPGVLSPSEVVSFGVVHGVGASERQRTKLGEDGGHFI